MALKRKTQTQIIANGVVRGIADSLLRFLIAPAAIAGIVYLLMGDSNENRLVVVIIVYGISFFLFTMLSLLSQVKEDEDVLVDSTENEKSN